MTLAALAGALAVEPEALAAAMEALLAATGGRRPEGGSPPALWAEPAAPDVVYLPSCATRIAGPADRVRAVLEIGARAGLHVLLPRDCAGICCGRPWRDAALAEGRACVARRMVERLWAWSAEGSVPVVCDSADCARALTELPARELSAEWRGRHARVRMLGLDDWIRDEVAPRLPGGGADAVLADFAGRTPDGR